MVNSDTSMTYSFVFTLFIYAKVTRMVPKHTPPHRLNSPPYSFLANRNFFLQVSDVNTQVDSLKLI